MSLKALQNTSNAGPLLACSTCERDSDFELSEAQLETVVAGNPIYAFNQYAALRDVRQYSPGEINLVH